MRTLDFPRIPGRHLLSVLCIVSAAACASGGGHKTRPAKTSGKTAAPAPAAPHFPNEDLAAKYQAARGAPKDFGVVMLYANTLAQFCLDSLVDPDCEPPCATAKRKPASELPGESRQLAEGALAMLDRLMTAPDLSWEQIGEWAVLKGRLLGLSGRTAAERTLIDDYVIQHPESVPVIRRRLELLREAGDRKALEAQCADSRTTLKSIPDPARLELLTSCVSLHPANTEGRTDPLDFAKYLPKMTKDEQRLYRQHMAKQCEQARAGDGEACSGPCTCEETDKSKCKEACKHCRDQAKARLRYCKKLQAR